MKGVVKWFSSRKAYGFIRGDDEQDYFVHLSKIQNRTDSQDIHEGDRCSFDVEVNSKGPMAVDVVIEAEVV